MPTTGTVSRIERPLLQCAVSRSGPPGGAGTFTMSATFAPPLVTSPIVHDTVELARDALNMEMAFVADTRGGVQQYVDIAGDADSFGAVVGEGARPRGDVLRQAARRRARRPRASRRQRRAGQRPGHHASLGH